MKHLALVAALGTALIGCRLFGNDQGDAPDMTVVESLDAGDTLTMEETDTYDRGVEPIELTQDLAVLADSFFDFDPTIDPLVDALENANRIAQRILDQLTGGADGGTCGTVNLSATTITVDFGAGCTLLSKLKVSGAASAAVSKNGGAIVVTFTFNGLKVNGIPLDGTASFATSTGTSFLVNADLTSRNGKLTMTDFTVAGQPGAIIFDGLMTATKLGVTTTLTFKSVAWKPSQCYPHSGSLQVKLGLITQTLIFDADTPQTGTVTVKVFKKTTTKQLPAYGACPPSPPDMF